LDLWFKQISKDESKLIYKILDDISERIHKFLSWQDLTKCKDCGKVIGVCGVFYGTEEEMKAEIDKKIGRSGSTEVS